MRRYLGLFGLAAAVVILCVGYAPYSKNRDRVRDLNRLSDLQEQASVQDPERFEDVLPVPGAFIPEDLQEQLAVEPTYNARGRLEASLPFTALAAFCLGGLLAAVSLPVLLRSASRDPFTRLPADGRDLAIRFGCGALLGALIAGFFALRVEPHHIPFAALMGALVCGSLGAVFGDRFFWFLARR